MTSNSQVSASASGSDTVVSQCKSVIVRVCVCVRVCDKVYCVMNFAKISQQWQAICNEV